MGTDTISGILTARKFYGCEMAGFSIPAAEHRWGGENIHIIFQEIYSFPLLPFLKGAVVAVILW